MKGESGQSINYNKTLNKFNARWQNTSERYDEDGQYIDCEKNATDASNKRDQSNEETEVCASVKPFWRAVCIVPAAETDIERLPITIMQLWGGYWANSPVQYNSRR